MALKEESGMASIEAAVAALWRELERQADGAGGPYVDREMDLVDGNIDAEAVVGAVLAAEAGGAETSTLEEAALRLWPFIALLKGGRVAIENCLDAFDAATEFEKAILNHHTAEQCQRRPREARS